MFEGSIWFNEKLLYDMSFNGFPPFLNTYLQQSLGDFQQNITKSSSLAHNTSIICRQFSKLVVAISKTGRWPTICNFQ